jgi:hypothetical protein
MTLLLWGLSAEANCIPDPLLALQTVDVHNFIAANDSFSVWDLCAEPWPATRPADC